jgi:hypothetical protein
MCETIAAGAVRQPSCRHQSATHYDSSARHGGHCSTSSVAQVVGPGHMARSSLMAGALFVFESTPSPAVPTLVLGRNLTSCAHWMCLSPHLQARHPSCQARLLRLHHHMPLRHTRVSPVGGQMLVMHWHETTAPLHTPAVRHPKSIFVFYSKSVRSAFIDDPAYSLLSPAGPTMPRRAAGTPANESMSGELGVSCVLQRLVLFTFR